MNNQIIYTAPYNQSNLFISIHNVYIHELLHWLL